MKVGVLGTGDVGRALSNACLALGHEVMMGARERGNPRAKEWADAAGSPKASTGNFEDAARFGELVFLCTLGVANKEVLRLAGPSNLAGKILIDTTNPLDFSQGVPPKLVVPAEGSGGAEVQAAVPEARVVKAFNTVGHALMYKPDLPGGPPDMFICGNDPDAKQRVRALLEEFGWGTVDVGGIDQSHFLEAMCMVWVASAMLGGTWVQAFKMLRK